MLVYRATLVYNWPNTCMPSFERLSSSNENSEVNVVLANYPGLRETLWAHCDPIAEEEHKLSMTLDEIGRIMAFDMTCSPEMPPFRG
jgi:hypothetical protein